VVLTSSCSPIGSLLVDTSTVESAVLDYIRAAPLLSLYEQGEWFKPAQHVKVIGVFGGVEDEIDIDNDNVEIKIINEPGVTGGDKESPVTDKHGGIRLVSKGVKNVVISYLDMETSYPIVVGTPNTSTWVEQNDTDGSGVTIIWKNKRR